MKPFLAIVLLLAAGATAWIMVNAGTPHRENPDVRPTPRELTREAGPGEAVRVIEVEGMCCTGCSGKLHAALLEVPGVVEAAVDFDTGTASALTADSVQPDVLVEALGFDKYTAKARP